MFERAYLQQLKRELRARGIWGRHAQTLIEETDDHLRETTAALREKGVAEPIAQAQALQLTGAPRLLAQAATDGLRGQHAIGRHPWLLCGAALFMALVATFVAVVALAFYVTVTRHWLYGPILTTLVTLANWGPFFLGVAFLAWMTRSIPSGWKPLLIACVAVGLASSAFTLRIWPHSAMVNGDTWAAILLYLTLPHHYLPNPVKLFSALGFVKLLLPIAACVIARRTLAIRSSEPTAE